MNVFNHEEAVPILKKIVEHHNVMKRSFNWNPPVHANNRRKYEKDNSYSYSFIYEDNSYDVLQKVRCSCKHIYYTLTILKNGIDYGEDVRFIKKIINNYLPDGVEISSPNWKYNYEKETITLLKPNMIIDCKGYDPLNLIVLNDTTILNPGFNCTILRKDIRGGTKKLLIAFIKHITNSKGVSGYRNQEEINARIFDNNL